MSRGVGDFALSGFIVTVERCRVLPKNDASRDVIVKCAQVLSERRGGGGTGFWHRFPQNMRHPMQTWERKKEAAGDLVRARPELGTDGGEPSVVRRAVASRASHLDSVS
jgi:hypothetical protein